MSRQLYVTAVIGGLSGIAIGAYASQFTDPLAGLVVVATGVSAFAFFLAAIDAVFALNRRLSFIGWWFYRTAMQRAERHAIVDAILADHARQLARCPYHSSDLQHGWTLDDPR